MVQKEIFISYHDKSSEFAYALCEELERMGHACWIASRDILPGASWSEAIVSALESTRALVLVFSSNAADSERVKREVGIALKAGKDVFPVQLENTALEGTFKFMLAGARWIDAVGVGADSVWSVAQQVGSHL